MPAANAAVARRSFRFQPARQSPGHRPDQRSDAAFQWLPPELLPSGPRSIPGTRGEPGATPSDPNRPANLLGWSPRSGHSSGRARLRLPHIARQRNQTLRNWCVKESIMLEPSTQGRGVLRHAIASGRNWPSPPPPADSWRHPQVWRCRTAALSYSNRDCDQQASTLRRLAGARIQRRKAALW